MMPDQHNTTITITPLQDQKGKANIITQYQVLRIKDNDSDLISCCIPAFDIYFSAPSMDETLKRSNTMVNSFLRYWINQQSFKKFISQIIKLGFRTDNLTLVKLTHGEEIKTKTSMNLPTRGIVPPEFKNAESLQQEVEAVL